MEYLINYAILIAVLATATIQAFGERRSRQRFDELQAQKLPHAEIVAGLHKRIADAQSWRRLAETADRHLDKYRSGCGKLPRLRAEEITESMLRVPDQVYLDRLKAVAERFDGRVRKSEAQVLQAADEVLELLKTVQPIEGSETKSEASLRHKLESIHALLRYEQGPDFQYTPKPKDSPSDV